MEKVILIILDGWAHGPKPEASAIEQADKPFMDSLYKKFPYSELITHSESVGLPEGQMGNSEVGHLNIGAGRVIFQELLRINNAVKSDELKNEVVLQKALDHAKRNNKDVHFMGLVSDGGIHSHIDHLKALSDIAKDKELDNVFIHAFTDGRDTDPKSGTGFIKELQEYLEDSAGEIASVIGRYYAMDRDKRWERIKLAYDMLTEGKGYETKNLIAAMESSYDEGITDEFIKPVVKVNDEGIPVAVIKEGDVVICFNFRTDRCRQITMALTQQDFPDHGMKKLDLHYVTMTRYDETFKNIDVIFEKPDLKMTLGEVLAKENKTQLRIAETEKYPHVTFFFSGGREDEFNGEHRIMIPSPKVATYDLQPEMSAYKVKDAVIKDIKENSPDFICLNFANPDMVGHTGVFEAAVKAVETIDQCTKEVTETALKNGYTVIITADHGNADYLVNEDGSPNTAHTKNPVPFFVITQDKKYHPKPGKLGDIAPTVLKIMGIDIPEEMTGEILIEG